MIYSKNDLFEYLMKDKKALGINKKRPSIIGDDIWKFQIILRKLEYVTNCKNGICGLIYKNYFKARFHRIRIKLGFSIPINVFGPGLSIAHYGTIAVNGNAKIGKNCRIHEGVTIGSTGGSSKAPIIGDNVFIGSGAKIIGDITISNGVAIGVNCVVVKSILEPNISVAGVPAKKISNNGSKSFILENL